MSIYRPHLLSSCRSLNTILKTVSYFRSTVLLPMPRKGYDPRFSGSRHYHETTRAQEIRPGEHRAFIALGSNVGDRIRMIESACSDMTRRGISVRRTSSLYETQAMYKVDQDPFINGACEASKLPCRCNDADVPKLSTVSDRNEAFTLRIA